MIDKQNERLWSQVRAQVKRIDAEHAAKQPVQEVVDFATQYRELMRTQPMVAMALVTYRGRLAAAPRRPRRPLPVPCNRTDVAETARVVCLGWHEPRAVNRWVHERNLFWIATHSFTN